MFSPRPDNTDKTNHFSTSPESPALDRRRSSRRTTRIGLPRSPFSKDKELDKEAADQSESSLAQNNRTTTSSSSFTVLGNPTSAMSPPHLLADASAFSPNVPNSPNFKSGNPHPITDVSTPSDAHDMIVRFEIFIVKVPWLPGLHGIQFRRISGNAWQYSQLARTVLNELKL